MSFAAGKFSLRIVFLLNYDKRQVMLKLPDEPNEITTSWQGECGKGHGKGLVASGCKVSIVGESEIDRQAQAPLFHRLDKINFSRCVNILKQELLTG